jgi:hypothetical protein
MSAARHGRAPHGHRSAGELLDEVHRQAGLLQPSSDDAEAGDSSDQYRAGQFANAALEDALRAAGMLS